MDTTGSTALPASGPLAFVGGSGCKAQTGEAVLREFAEAGFTHSWYAFGDEREGRTVLDAAQAVGVKIIAKQQEAPMTAEEVARQFKDHPALAGYMLLDEPSAAEFPVLTQEARNVLAVDPDKLVLVNLYPNGANHIQMGIKPYQGYSEYVYKFLSEVPVNLLSYDCYPIKRVCVLEGWYDNMEVMFEASRRAKLPLWVWIASVGMDLTPDPTIGSFRLQAYTNLAYGVTGVEHFCYHTHKGLGMRMGCIERDGSRTPTYDLVKQLHCELQAQAGVFVGSTIQRVRYAGSTLPRGPRPWKPFEGITALEAGNKGAVVTNLARDTYRFLVVVNQDYLQPMPLSVEWKNQMSVGSVQKDGSVQMLEGSSLHVQVAPGDAAILMWMAPDS